MSLEAVSKVGHGRTLRSRDCTIVFADIVDSGRVMQADEAQAVATMLDLFGRIKSALLPVHKLKLVEERGDSLLLESDDPVPAVNCCLAMMEAAAHTSVALRIGIHRADVLTDEKLLFGHGVNVAARIAASAPPGDVLASDSVIAGLPMVDRFDAEDLGLRVLKHVKAPIRLYRLRRVEATPLPIRLPPESLVLQPTVAVLPLSMMDAASGQVGNRLGIGDVITDHIVGALSRSPALRVISRLSSQVFRPRHQEPVLVAESLAANVIVSGHVIARGKRLHVQLQVVEMPGGRVLGTVSSHGSFAAALHTDSTLIAPLASGICELLFRAAVEAAGTTPMPNLQSHTLLIAAVNLLYRLSPSDFARAREALETLQDRSPRHPSPLAWLARWHLFRVVQGWSEDREADGLAAYTYAQRALELDPSSSLALTMLGNVHTNYLRKLGEAERLYDQALAINPNESLAWLQRGNCLSFRGLGDEALAQTQRAVRLSPLDPARHFYQSLLASAALTAGRFARAAEAARASLKLNVDHISSHRVLTIALAMLGDLPGARAAATELLAREPGLTVKGFVARSPGQASGLAERFGEALSVAGIPDGSAA